MYPVLGDFQLPGPIENQVPLNLTNTSIIPSFGKLNQNAVFDALYIILCGLNVDDRTKELHRALRRPHPDVPDDFLKDRDVGGAG